jgi:bile acid-coenzyme A ligase
MTERVPPISTQVTRLAQVAPDEPAVTCQGRTLSRGELDASTNRLARAYAEFGVGVGDYVAVVLDNSIEWVQAVLAAWKLGAVPQPLSPRGRAGGSARQIPKRAKRFHAIATAV